MHSKLGLAWCLPCDICFIGSRAGSLRSGRGGSRQEAVRQQARARGACHGAGLQGRLRRGCAEARGC